MAPLRPLFAAVVCSCASGRGNDADVEAGPIYSADLRLCALGEPGCPDVL